MHAIVGEFPGVEIVDYYDTHFPESWDELVPQEVNGTAYALASFVQIDFWDGLTSVSGYGPIRFLDSTFYKTWHVRGASWDTALSYNVNRMLAYLSRHLSNWSYASTRINISPFAWIDGDVANEGSFTAPRDPAYVAEQLAFFRRWAMGAYSRLMCTARSRAASTTGPTPARCRRPRARSPSIANRRR